MHCKRWWHSLRYSTLHRAKGGRVVERLMALVVVAQHEVSPRTHRSLEPNKCPTTNSPAPRCVSQLLQAHWQPNHLCRYPKSLHRGREKTQHPDHYANQGASSEMPTERNIRRRIKLSLKSFFCSPDKGMTQNKNRMTIRSHGNNKTKKKTN